VVLPKFCEPIQLYGNIFVRYNDLKFCSVLRVTMLGKWRCGWLVCFITSHMKQHCAGCFCYCVQVMLLIPNTHRRHDSTVGGVYWICN